MAKAPQLLVRFILASSVGGNRETAGMAAADQRPGQLRAGAVSQVMLRFQSAELHIGSGFRQLSYHRDICLRVDLGADQAVTRNVLCQRRLLVLARGIVTSVFCSRFAACGLPLAACVAGGGRALRLCGLSTRAGHFASMRSTFSEWIAAFRMLVWTSVPSAPPGQCRDQRTGDIVHAMFVHRLGDGCPGVEAGGGDDL